MHAVGASAPNTALSCTAAALSYLAKPAAGHLMT